MFRLPDCGNLLASVQQALRFRNIVSNALEILVSGVAPVIVLTFIGVARLPYLPSFPTSTTGITLDASSKHIRFAICSEVDP